MAKWSLYLRDRRLARSLAGRRRHTQRSRSLKVFFLLALPCAAFAADGCDLAENGNGKGAHQCSACHGAQGEGRPDAAYPRLAGIDVRYLLRQLNDFADGNRDIGVHHIHHLCSRIPYYRLPLVLRDYPDLGVIGRLTLMQSFRCVRLVLWDEGQQRLVSFREAQERHARA